tara:strand:- start:789 stop:1130 length:342 start_codon:yes stop_codon:yes gene_type:complete
MKSFVAATVAIIAFSGAASAQTATTTQANVLGASSDAVYSLQVQGANGVVYNCKPDPVTVDGNTARVCVRAENAGLFDAGSGIGSAGGIAGAALVLVAIAAGSSSSTTTTTTN